MKKNRFRNSMNGKLNNRGGSLILVVISVAFVGILGSIILSMAITNLQMKVLKMQTDKNFYKAEGAIEEIKAGLKEVTANTLEEAYKTLLRNYANSTEEERERLLTNTFMNGLYNTLNDQKIVLGGVISEGQNYQYKLLKSFITDSDIQLEYSTDGMKTYVERSPRDKYLLLKDVCVQYVSEDKIKTTITTDIEINAPDLTFGNSSSGNYLKFSSYTIIADQKLVSENGTNQWINGNIYAGEDGILVKNFGTNLNITAENMVTRGDIEVSDTGNLHASGDIWTMNIVTSSKNMLNPVNKTTVNLNGKIYVKDDLTLGAKNSDVTIAGEYYGYSHGDRANNSSAIMINQTKASLDLSNLDRIILAGRAFLSQKNLFTDANLTNSLDNQVQTGESLAIKGNQIAYLVPEKYCTLGHNPITKTEYLEAINSGKKLVQIDPKSEIYKYLKEGENNQYTSVFYRYTSVGPEPFVYFYLNFRTENDANQYFKKYYQENNVPKGAKALGIMDQRIGAYLEKEGNGIKLNNKLIRFIGNVVSYDTSTGKSSMKGSTINPNILDPLSDSSIKLELDNISNQYKSITKNLTTNIIDNSAEINSIFNAIIDKDKLQKDALRLNQLAHPFDGNKKKIIQIGQDTTVVCINNDTIDYHSETKKGIIIATGNVIVQNDFEGLILSGGRVTLQNQISVKSNYNLIMDILNKNNDEINRYFKGLSMDHSDSNEIDSIKSVDIKSLILTKNWRKNE